MTQSKSPESTGAILDAVADGIVVVDADGTIVHVNARIHELFGWSEDQLLGRPVEVLMPEADRHAHRALRDGFLESPERRAMDAGFEVEALHEDGSTFPVEISLGPVETDGGQRVVAAIRPCSRRRRLEAELRDRELKFRSLFENSRDAVFVTSPEGEILDINQAGVELFGYEADEMRGMDVGRLYADSSERRQFRETLERKGAVKDYAVDLQRADGTVMNCVETTSVQRDENGEVVAYLGIVRDVTERKRSRERLRHKAMHDWLTGLPNRGLLRDRLEQAIGKARREGTVFGVLFIDLDDFKLVNDGYGHGVGDAVLQEVARRFESSFRGHDTVARIGGDEFVAVLEGFEDASEIPEAAQRCQKLVHEPIRVDEYTIQVTASIGVTCWPDEEGGFPEVDTIIEAADCSMYRAKKRCRSSLEFACERPPAS